MLPALNGATRIHVTIGDPIAQVKSPAGMTQGFYARGADAIMIPLQVKPADIDEFFHLAKKLPNLDGIIITVPHKPVAFRHCDDTSERSRVLEVCNVMRRDSGRPLDRRHDRRRRLRRCAQAQQLRPEGQARAAGRRRRRGLGDRAGALDRRARASRWSMSIPRKRDALIARLGKHGHKVVAANAADPSGFDLVVNATPAGMKDGDPLPVDASKLSAGQFVADVITMPAMTPLLEAAKAKGCRTQTGVEMFNAQVDFISEFLLGK